MCSKRLRNALQSVRVRLTLGLGAVFFACTVAAFLFMYLGLEAALLRSVDETLREEVEECETLYAQNGVEGVKEELRLEESSHDRKEIYFRVLSPEGRLLAASPGVRWEPGLDPEPVSVRQAGALAYATRRSIESGESVRIVQATLGPDAVVRVYHGLADNVRLLREIRSLFLLVLAVLLLVSVGGTWFALRRTMAGVEAVTQAALDIQAGDLRRRVAVGTGGREIETLAAAFNTMLDKVAALVGALRQVTDDIAHEMRSPIARIRGAAEMAVLRGPQPDNWQEAAGSIVEECDDLLSLVNGMLDLAEMQAGLARMNRETVNLPQLVRDTCDLFTPAAEDAGVALEVAPFPSFAVCGDAQKLRRAFANLIDNAIKYTPGGGRVRVTAEADDGQAIVAIEDTGVGIEPEELPHVFERFYRADRSRTKGGKGLGLGIARAVVALHGGRIDVASRPGEGSTFTVVLPASPLSGAPRNGREHAPPVAAEAVGPE